MPFYQESNNDFRRKLTVPLLRPRFGTPIRCVLGELFQRAGSGFRVTQTRFLALYLLVSEVI